MQKTARWGRFEMSNEVDYGGFEITDELIAERKNFKPGQTPDDMTPWMRPIVAFIDLVNLWVGRGACLLVLPIIVVMVTEVVSRKVFLSPTDYSYEYSRMIAGAMFMLGAGYALMRGVHIRADFIYRTWSPQKQMTVDGILYLAFYFPAMLFFFWVSFEYTLKAWVTWERSMDTAMMAPLAPARTAMPIAAFLLFLQGISEYLKTLYEMDKKRRRLFLRIVPIYAVGLALVFTTVAYPNITPIADWWTVIVASIGLGGIEGEMIGLIMIAVMLFSIFVGFPISFTLIFLAFVFGAWGFKAKLAFYLQALQFNATMMDEQLVAVPLFVFMGILMEKAGLMERLFTSIQLMFSRTRGALFVAVLFVSMIFAAATGIVGASVTILGIMAARTMNKSGYDVRLAAGAITAGGTLGILIPPSIMLVVMGPVLQVPVTTLFQAAIIPGVMLAFLYMAYALVRCWINPNLGPILPPDEQPVTSNHYMLEFGLVMYGIVVFIALITASALGKPILGFAGATVLIPLMWLFAMALSFRSIMSLRAIVIIALPVNIFMLLAKISTAFALSSESEFSSIATLLPLGFLVLKFSAVSTILLKSLQVIFNSKTSKSFFFSDLWYEFFMGLVPPTILIAFALGSILAGWATPAEAAACGAFGAILLALAYRKLTLPSFYDAMIKTLEITVLIMFLVAASNFFGAVFSRLGTPTMLTEMLLAWDLSPLLVMLIVMALIFLLGWPLEWVPIVLIIVPILIPTVVALDLGFESTEQKLTWFAILVAVNLQTAWLSPPVAMSAYFLKGVVPEWDLKDIYLGMMQFMLIQLLGLILIFCFPQIALWLPEYIYGK
jgi:TRAP-type mannitol/chloroaromatic compound transport system permease large subunit/TRAP-type mannitol/chloroaromatic compound transport system permease small subunit